MKGLHRTHFQLPHILTLNLRGKHDQASAYYVSLLKAIHQVVLDDGSWTDAALLLIAKDAGQGRIRGERERTRDHSRKSGGPAAALASQKGCQGQQGGACVKAGLGSRGSEPNPATHGNRLVDCVEAGDGFSLRGAMLGLNSMDTNLKGSTYARFFRWLLRRQRTADSMSTCVKPDDANFVLLPMRLLLQS